MQVTCDTHIVSESYMFVKSHKGEIGNMSQSNDLSPMGLKIDAIREKREITLYRVGKNAQMDHSQLYRIMRGKVQPTRKTLLRICKALNCTEQEAAEIFKGTGYVAPSVDELEEQSVSPAA